MTISPVYTSGSISIPPLEYKKITEVSLTFNKSDMHKVSHTASVELNMGISSGQTGGAEGSLKTKYEYGEEFVKEVQKGCSVKSMEEVRTYWPINGFTVPVGKQVRYIINELKSIINLPFTSKIKYKAEAIILPSDVPIDRYEIYTNNLNYDYVAHFLVEGEGLNIADLEKVDDKTIIANITGTSQESHNEFEVIYQQATLGTSNWEVFYP